MVRCYYIYPPSSEAIDYRSSPLLLRHPNPTNSQTGDGYQHNLKAGFEINSRKVQRSPSQAAVPQKSRATFADPRTDEAVQEEHCQSMITSPPTLLTRTSVDALIGLFEDELR